MDDCIFCKIANGNILAKKIYENEYVYAFLDASPKGKGHTLVIPKAHFENIYDVNEKVLCDIYTVVKKLSIHLKKKLNCGGITIVQNNEEIGGQSVFHLHVHILPKYEVEENDYDMDELWKLLSIEEL
ncbi:MAG: HIT-family protein, Hit-like protein involved in cell-cycle regulation [candidate division WS6 bacterium GW2011_GWC1_33_20]|uniref:HIT domain-containing protein n=2 Tax=Candidatus Dojkabacteria TaxID=74243 RepID=A0A0G0AE00_9BACT|nr:MAG: HIT-family protein, Hit-like protein involved in cell-cycle regulation [candidate division WS6 bacterium GW2011_GWE2_33_157]KKP44506.1 MAG: HIT-family protein, Hit-like protein involved in cell-cycle regulation [candidate division WS6 bacterium GW2011_GWC1_33_20]KKP44646.1 MAG: HIT-family protein, Hit-like protein involved in cell-cycle regulation [candidate division WS6 bacterium GW2011_GWF1_33_233]KKP54282.1 MAG: HIT-family protein, Hit-like protein involved in cell-cycle regulation [c